MKVKEHESKVICLMQFKCSLIVTRTQTTRRSIFQLLVLICTYNWGGRTCEASVCYNSTLSTYCTSCRHI